ncbi:MAG TPA: HIT domain-containing protein [Ignavibacteria bacterium]
MNYKELEQFLVSGMRMSHIYQPVMIRLLLNQKGKASVREIAEEILRFDPSQIEYYEKIVNNMVGKVLRNHKIVTKLKSEYILEGCEIFADNEIISLIDICNQKLTTYINKRGEILWQHRRRNRNLISGSIRFEVLKRAKFRCELCGISAEEKALEVDHIVPKNLGGLDSINNYQALCYTCNAMKRDKDKTDFRNYKDMYDFRDKECIFCNIDKQKIKKENNLAILVFDNFPVTEHHSLIIPKRHFKNYFEISQAELNAVNELLFLGKDYINNLNSSVKGYNIGINSGEIAGQSIMHCHIHLIPRYFGDVENPKGGVRHVIPGKGYY